MRRRLTRYGLRTIGVIVGLTALYFGAAFGLAYLPMNGDAALAADDSSPGIVIGVSSNGIHANLHLPVVAAGIDWRQDFPMALFPDTPAVIDSISFGWGHKDFYLNTPTWDQFDPLVGAQAMVGIGDAALHVGYWPPQALGEHFVLTRISVEDYRALAAYIQAAIVRGDDGRPLWIEGFSYKGNDAFFEAHGSYNLFVTCNEWVRRGLAVAGVRTGWWSPFPGPLLDHLRPS